MTSFKSMRKSSYGPLGILTRGKWEKLLASGEGLFKPVSTVPVNIIGPTMTPGGDVVGDMLAMETTFFNMNATSGQVDLYTSLANDNPAAAREYLLVIIGALHRWRSDIKLLRKMLNYLRNNEELIEREERHRNGHCHSLIAENLPATLKRHFPGIFKDIDISGKSIAEICDELKYIKDRVRFEELYLQSWLRDARDRMPFLFD